MIIRNSNQDQIKSWLDISGIVNETDLDPKITWDLKTPAAIITKAVGVEEMRKLHHVSKWMDAFFIVLAWTLFTSVWVLIATLDFGFLTILLIILQGIIIGNFFYAIRHDALMHRQLGGSRVAYIVGILFSIPMLNPYTFFLRHEDHHLHVGYDLFEEHIAELDTVKKRWLALTGIGLVLLFAGKLKTKNTPIPNLNWKNPDLVIKATKKEMKFHALWLLAIPVLAFFWPYTVMMGYVLPIILVVPFVVSLKNACQHTETDIDNKMHLSANFKANVFWRILYCCSIGDVHIVHHIFPRIPFWKTPKAARLFRKTFIEHGVPERTMTQVLIGYYIKGNPYRKRWMD